MAQLRLPKKARQGSSPLDPTGPAIKTPTVQRAGPHKRVPFKNGTSEDDRRVAAPDGVASAISRAIDETTARREQRRGAKRATAAASAADFGRWWQIECEAVWPQAVFPAWGGKQRGQARNLYKRWPVERREEMLSFCSWVIENWKTCLEVHFRWANITDLPEFPQIGFVLAFVERWTSLYYDRDRVIDRAGGLTERGKLIQRHRREGLTLGAAQAEADRTLEERRKRGNAQKVIADAAEAKADVLRVAGEAEDRLIRLARRAVDSGAEKAAVEEILEGTGVTLGQITTKWEDFDD